VFGFSFHFLLHLECAKALQSRAFETPGYISISALPVARIAFGNALHGAVANVEIGNRPAVWKG
jgi:hypothetical protein